MLEFTEAFIAEYLNFFFIMILLGVAMIGVIREKKKAFTYANLATESQKTQLPKFFRAPSIDPTLCIGCSSCVKKCPRTTPLEIRNHKSELVNAKECIGCGRCELACPMAAISMVNNPNYIKKKKVVAG
ncbi:MAG: hypothetical protein CMP10_18770 [Zetaproteobacteria bacterium]|nr:hypothetical protein [Pseudobdellovibrionaceae bacterium]